MEGVKGTAYRHVIRPGEWDVRNNGLRPSLPSRALGLDTLPWPLRSHWPRTRSTDQPRWSSQLADEMDRRRVGGAGPVLTVDDRLARLPLRLQGL